jgi:osmotically-inducible protein OsmY
MFRQSLTAAVLVAGTAFASPLLAQLQFGSTAGIDSTQIGGGTGTAAGGGTTGGGTTGGGTTGQADLGPQGQLIDLATGSGQITETDRFYRAPTIERARTTFVGADTSDTRNFISPSVAASVASMGSAYGGTGGTRTATGTTAARTGTQGGLSFASAGRATGGLAGGGFGGLNSGLGGLTGFGGAAGLGQTGLQGATGTGAQTQQRVRAQMALGFTPRAVAAPQLGNQLASRLARVGQLQSSLPVQVELVGRTAVLRGTVDSDHARDLAERLAMLEPGVSAVQNELTVGTAPAVGAAGAEE